MLQTDNSLLNRNTDDGSIADFIPSPSDAFKTFLDFARRQYPVIAFAVAVAIALGLVYILTTPPSFTATTTMLIDTNKVRLFGQQSIFNDLPIDSSEVESQVEILKSENIALAVIKSLKLDDDPRFVGGGGGLIGTLLGTVTGWFTSGGPSSQYTNTRAAVGVFERGLTIRRVGLTYVVLISFQSYSPERAAQIANAVSNAYLDDQLEAKFDAARRASTWLQTRLTELRQQASTAEAAVVAFKNKNDMVDAGGRTINEQQLAELNSELVVARSQTATAQARVDRVQDVLQTNSPEATVTATVSDTLKNDVITKLRSQYLELAAREADWAVRYGVNHLAVVNLRNQMREIQNSIRNELQRIAETYKSDLEIAKQHEASVQQQLNKAVAQSEVAGEAQVSLRDLQSNAQTYRALYDNFLQRYMESVQQQSFPVTEARILTVATPPSSKSSPKTLLVTGLAILVGLVFGFIAAAWRDFADRVFRTIHQVESFLQTDCIALIPMVKGEDPKEDISAPDVAYSVDKNGGVAGGGIRRVGQRGSIELANIGQRFKTVAEGVGQKLGSIRHGAEPAPQRRNIQIAPEVKPAEAGEQAIVLQSPAYSTIVDAPFSAFSEAIRSVKVAIDLSPTVTGGRIIGFTSAVPNEGKSTIAAAVARWVAQTGSRTLLIDCDLRNPKLSRTLSPQAGCGLIEVLKNQGSLERAIWSDRATGMKFLPATAASRARFAHSSEVLASTHMRKCLDILRNGYDYIFLDFSPLMPIVDVRVSTNLVDGYIFVVAWGDTRIEFAKQALHSARGVHEHLLGAVLNKVNLTAVDRYDGTGGYYYHGNYARYGYTE